MPTALIFRERLLPTSETFIVEQASALKRYRAVLTGIYRTMPTVLSGLEEVVAVDGKTKAAKCLGRIYGYLSAQPSFLKKLVALDPTVLHAHFAIDGVKALPIAEAMQLPLIVTLHGYDVTTSDDYFANSFSGRHYLRNRRKLFDRAQRFICVSRSIREAALRAGFPEGKLQVLYTGIDCHRFRSVHSERDPDLVLFVGRLVEKKGCEFVLRAMAMLRESRPAAHLEIIGDGPLRAELEELARCLQVRVKFRGIQSSEEVRLSMSRARVLCNPSVTAANGDSEGFGMVLAEAQAVGTPVVSSWHAAIPEAVSHGETGILCAERDFAAIAEALATFLGDDEFWMRTSTRAAAWVRENFDISHQAKKLEDIFDESCSQPRVLEANRLKRASLSPEMPVSP